MTLPLHPPSITSTHPGSLNILKSNLQEIYTAVHHPQLDLVANIQGTRVYVSSNGFGRLWTFFYRVIGILKPKTIHAAKNRKLMQALHKTHLIYQQRMQHVEAHLKEYREYLQSACHGYVYTGDVKKVNQSRWEITNWNDATLPFLELLHKKKNAQLINLLQNYFPQTPDQLKQPVFSSERLLECSQVQSVIDLESVLQSSMPFEALGRLWRGQHQNETQLRQCIRIIKQRQNDLSTHIFHEGVKSMIELDVSRNTKDNQQKLVLVEVMLIDEGCNNLFVKKDVEHLAWRDSLKEGDQISCNGKTLILGKQVGIPQLHDKTVLFEIQDRPNSLVMIKINRAILAIKQELQLRLSQASNGTYRIIPYQEIDRDGTCALVPKLHESLQNIAWITQPTDEKVAKADSSKFFSLCDFIKNMAKNQITPKFFSSETLMFDQQGQIWFFKPPQEGPFDFNALQDFTLNVSNNNLTIFRHLMHASGIDSHPIADVYRLVVKEALKETNHENVANIVQRAQIDTSFGSKSKILKDPLVIRAHQLYSEMMALRQRCVRELQRTRNISPEEAVKIASKGLFSAYKKTNAAGILWPTLNTLTQF